MNTPNSLFVAIGVGSPARRVDWVEWGQWVGQASVDDDRLAARLLYQPIMVFEQMVDRPHERRHVFVAQHRCGQDGRLEATDHPVTVVGIIDHPHTQIDVFLLRPGDQLLEANRAQQVGR